MKHLKFVAMAVLALAVMAGAADAQKKSTRKKTTKSASSTTMPPLEVRAAREKVEIQLHNVKSFLDVFGPVAQDLQDLDPRDQKLPKNEANKQKLIVTIRNLRDSLSTLESHFRTTPVLQKYLTSISGITELAAQSEDFVIAGKFVASKEPLRSAAQKLTDTLNVMPTGGTVSNLMPMDVSNDQQSQYQLIKEPKVGDGPTFIVGTFRTRAEADKKAAQEAAKPENSGFRFVVEKVAAT